MVFITNQERIITSDSYSILMATIVSYNCTIYIRVSIVKEVEKDSIYVSYNIQMINTSIRLIEPVLINQERLLFKTQIIIKQMSDAKDSTEKGLKQRMVHPQKKS